MGIRWPRGKFNGKRIVGFEIGFRFRIGMWNWIPHKPRYSGLFHWLCFTLKLEAVYGN